MLRLGSIQPIPCKRKRLGGAKVRLPEITGQFHPSGNLGPSHLLFFTPTRVMRK